MAACGTGRTPAALLTVLLTALLLPGLTARAAIDAYEFDDPAQQRQFTQLTAELRCPKCQNQNIADSDAPLAADLREKVYTMTRGGASHEQIVEFMTQRYGDFVTYRPPLKPLTWVLWFGPLVAMLAVASLVVLWISRRNRQRAAEASALNAEERARLERLLARHAPGDGADGAAR